MQNPAILTSRQRILNAIEHKPVDHVPLLLRFWSIGADVDQIPFDWRDEIARVEATTALGLDDTLLLEPPLGYVENYAPEELPGVASRTIKLPPAPGEEHPRLHKTFPTPFGPLEALLTWSDDWPYGEQVIFFDDYNIPRFIKPWVVNQHDLPRLTHLLAPPGAKQILQFKERAALLRQEAGRLGVLLDGGWTALGDTAMWLCGMQRILYGQMDEPGFIEQVLDVIFEWEMGRIDLLLAEGVDEIVHMAWYEGTDFWTPKNYRRLLKPRLRQMVEKVHAHGRKFRYIITKGWQPLSHDLIELGIDCLTGVDPVQDRLDLSQVKQSIGSQICLMGGLNSGIMLSNWEQAQIEEAVDYAIETLFPGDGFILYPVDAIFDNQPWEKVDILIKRWRQHWTGHLNENSLSTAGSLAKGGFE